MGEITRLVCESVVCVKENSIIDLSGRYHSVRTGSCRLNEEFVVTL